MFDEPVSRRRLLAAAGVTGLGGIAGCAGVLADGDDADTPRDGDGTATADSIGGETPGEQTTDARATGDGSTGAESTDAATTTEAGGTDGATDEGSPAVGTATDGAADDGTYGIAAVYPKDGETTRELILRPEDFASIGDVQERAGTFGVRVTLTHGGAEQFTEALENAGFLDSEGVASCNWSESPEDPGWCLVTVVDGEDVFGAGITAGLAELIDSGEFTANPTVLIQTSTESRAEALKDGLESGQD